MTTPSSSDLTLALRIAQTALLFGQIRRATQHADGEEHESDTTHTVMLAMLVIELAPRLGLDVGMAVQFAVVHDLPETYAHDTCTLFELTPEQAAERAAREAAAVERLAGDLDDARCLRLLRTYEAQELPEARLVRYLDKVLPKLTHFINRGSALRKLGATAGEVRDSHQRQLQQLAEQYPELHLVSALFADAAVLVEREVLGLTETLRQRPFNFLTALATCIESDLLAELERVGLTPAAAASHAERQAASGPYYPEHGVTRDALLKYASRCWRIAARNLPKPSKSALNDPSGSCADQQAKLRAQALRKLTPEEITALGLKR